jgi:hypothetical protein
VLSIFRPLLKLSVTLQTVFSDCLRFCAAALRSRTALSAENLFLRKQLALFQERGKKAAPTTAADRFVFSKLVWSRNSNPLYFDVSQRSCRRRDNVN